MTDTNPGSPWQRLGTGERLIGVGCLIMLVSLFPTWMGAHLYYTDCTSCTAPGGDKNAFSGIGIVVVLVLLVTAALLVARSAFARSGNLGLTDGPVYMIAGAVELVCVIVYYAEFHTVSTGGTRSPAIGFYGAIMAALLTTAGGVAIRMRPRAVLSSGGSGGAGGSGAGGAGGSGGGQAAGGVHDPYQADAGSADAGPYGSDPYGTP